ncbi:MAG: transketolase [Lentisphaerae bacterium]|nr:transketolase [Lentisphaerota bacterium]MCP4101037.1 transketolase [Lentisphaerota bacterium]
MDKRLARLSANTIRVLSAEAIQKAKSGHPGMPMGCADFAITLWYKYMRHNPRNPQWLGRDRFILSAGHGSMLQYSLLHLFDYGLSMDELKQFRQWGSLTPGHPEFGHTAGADITTGPLGSGFASGVGMAIANKYFAARTGLDKTDLVDNKIFMISGDGCMMEGTTAEAGSLAGHLKLDNLVCFYDDNSITIEGSTELAFSEEVGARFTAYNWRVIRIEDANDIEQCDRALAETMESDGRPTLIIGRTQIGYGSPGKQGKSSSHGEPLGVDEVAATKKNLGLPEDDFFVLPEVSDFCDNRVEELVKDAAEWDKKFQEFIDSNPEEAKVISSMMNCELPENLLEELLKVSPVDKAVATRASGGTVLQRAFELVPALVGGAADLAPSTKTDIKGAESFTAENRHGCNLHFGVRELAMGMAGNGMALYGTAIPYTSTFFVFSDYMKPALRLAAIQGLHEIYVFTHDSFYVGEDGPTHEPIEQIAMLRTIPGFTVLRPAEAREVAHSWTAALQADGPVALLLTRQNLEPICEELAGNIDVAKGAYVLDDDKDFSMILMATGSEVNLALETAKLIREKGCKVRVVSMPSQEFFLKQSKEYQESVLPKACKNRVSIEAATTFGWSRFVGDEGLAIGIDHFGASAPFSVLAEKFGFTPEAVLAKIKEHFGCSC